MIFLNTTKRYIYLMAVLLGVALTAISCGDDLKNVTYQPTNNNISFSSASIDVSVPLEKDEFNVKIMRGVADNAVTVDLKIADENGIFSLKTPAVTFDQGVFEQVVVVKYTASKLQVGKIYNVELSFNDVDKAITGDSKILVKTKLLLDYEEYGTISCASGSYFGTLPADKRSYKLYLAKGTTNFYKIEKLYGSETDVEIGITDGKVSFFSPAFSTYNAEDVKDYPLCKIVTAMDHPTYGIMTAWLDSEPENVTCSALGANDKLILNSTMSIWTWYTVSAGYFGWDLDNLKVTAVK